MAVDSPALVKELYNSGMQERSPNNLVFNFGGFTVDLQISVFDPRRGFFDLPVSLPFSLVYSGVVLEESEIFLVGGWRGWPEGLSSGLHKFNLEDWTFTTLSSMNEVRSSHAVTKIGKMIYALGGSGSGGWEVRTVERYDITKDQWTDCGEMKDPRSGAGVAALNGLIYVIGGFNQSGHLSSVEIFDTEKGTWTMGKPLMKKRSGVQAAVLNGKIYVVGGSSGWLESLRCGEVFDPNTGEWTELPKMNVPRSNYSLFVADGQLMVVGGIDGVDVWESLTETTEILDLKTNTWIFDKAMKDAKAAVASCSVPVRDMKPELRKKYRDLCSP